MKTLLKISLISCAMVLLTACAQDDSDSTIIETILSIFESDDSSNSNEIEAQTYTDDRDESIELSLGEAAFATKAIEYGIGDPKPIPRLSVAGEALGAPDYDDSDDSGYVSLGGDGFMVLQFENAHLQDGDGDDIYIFEVGPSVEATEVEISEDGEDWINLGEVSGGTSSIDIAPFVESSQKFEFVKLTSTGDDNSGSSPGADIDAVAIINGALQ